MGDEKDFPFYIYELSEIQDHISVTDSIQHSSWHTVSK